MNGHNRTPLLQRVTQLVGEDSGTVGPLSSVLGETAIDRLGQAARHERRHGAERRGRLGHLFGKHLGRLLRFERQRARECEIADDAERVEVAPPVHNFAQRLLGTHEFRRSHHFAGGQRTRAGDRTGNPEIRDEHAAAVLEQDIVGLDVAMDDALRMRVGERPGDVAQDARCLRRRQWAAPPHTVGERFALDV